MSLPALNDKADDTVSRVARYPVSNPWATTKQVLKLMASRRSSVQGPVSKSDPLCQVALSCSRKPSHFACTGNVPSPCILSSDVAFWLPLAVCYILCES